MSSTVRPKPSGGIERDYLSEPVTKHRIHHDIKLITGKEATLGHAALRLDDRAVVAALSGGEFLRLPVVLDQTQKTGAHTIFLHRLQGVVAVQGVISFGQIKIYLEEDRFEHGSNFLLELNLHNSSRSATSLAKTMENVVEANNFLNPSVDNGLTHFPCSFDEPNSALAAIRLGNHSKEGPRTT